MIEYLKSAGQMPALALEAAKAIVSRVAEAADTRACNQINQPEDEV